MLIFLTGFMCSGKTTDGRKVAEKLHLPFLDLDEELERLSGMSIWKFIGEKGVTAFRQMESEILLNTRQMLQKELIVSPSASPRPQAVIATGGGSVLNPENRAFLQQPEHEIIWLNLPFPVLMQRLKTAERPLLQGLTEAEIHRIYSERLPWYQMTATYQITAPPVVPKLASVLRKQITDL